MNEAYLTESQRFLSDYNQTEETVNCTGPTIPDDFPQKPCQFPLEQLGVCANPEKALADGEPCLFIRLNKVYGWLPDVDKNSSFPEASIICRGQNDIDNTFLGEPVYYPSAEIDGKKYGTISSVYFPYIKQPGYQAPIVAVQFPDIRPSTLVLVECEVYGLKTDHSLVTFEISVDGQSTEE